MTNPLRFNPDGTKTREFECWYNMKARCLNPNRSDYRHYGGRGITVCQTWLDSYEQFYADVGPKPGRGYDLDRIDTDQGYFKENCRWVLHKANTWNQRNNVRVTYQGREMILAEALQISGMHVQTFYYRVRHRGMSYNEALVAPLTRKRKAA